MQELNNKRVEKVVIGDTIYIVTVKEKDTATETPLQVIQKLLKYDMQMYIENNKKRICCLNTDNNGGRKVC